MGLCVVVCACERERKRGGERERGYSAVVVEVCVVHRVHWLPCVVFVGCLIGASVEQALLLVLLVLRSYLPSFYLFVSVYFFMNFQVKEVAHLMSEVVQVMTVKRRKERLAECLEYVNTNTTSYWAAQILMDLKAAGRSADRSIMSPVGFGLNFRVIGETGESSLPNLTCGCLRL